MTSQHTRPAIVITGIRGRLARLVATRLMALGERVIGIDSRPFGTPPEGIEVHTLDVRRRQAEDIFRRNEISAVVHMGIVHSRRNTATVGHHFNVVGTQTLLDYCHRRNVPKVVVLSSANIYGPRPGNAQYLDEDTPLLAGETFHDMRDLIAVDMHAQSYFWKHPEIETVVLRPVHIVGRVQNAPSNYLSMSTVPTLMGFDPMIQIIHEDDVVTGIVRALKPGIRGVFNLVGPGAVPLSAMIDAIGGRRLPVPGLAFRLGTALLYRLRLTEFPSPELDHIRYVCMVDGTRSRKVLDFAPEHGIRETLTHLKTMRAER
jgi:UDP-glucose 4-epimerase